MTTRAFLFADLRGYTDFVERRGDAAAARLLRDYRALVRREVARSAGAEVKTEGDSFYVVFDSASAALDCAVAIQRRAAEHNEREVDGKLRVGMGLHAGETVAFDKQFVGGAVNIAARMASQAGEGEVVVSDTLRGLVRTSSPYKLVDRGELALKGVSERLRAWTVEWDAAGQRSLAMPLAAPVLPSAPAPGQIVCPVLIGREADRGRAVELLDAARQGKGRTLIVAGEAGVGKSAYVREVVAAASERGFRPLYGATLEADGGLPYAPFLAAVRSGFRGLDRDRLGRVLAQAAPDLAELFPELGRAQRAGDPAAADQHRIAVAFHGLVTTFAREAPVLLVIEDLHWADEASLSLLQYLARELRDASAVLLATYRSDEMHRRHPVLRYLATLQRERLATEVTLRRLGREEIRELIRETFLPTDPTIRVTDPFLDAILARSEGNPFFTEELLKALVESGGLFFTEERGWNRKPIEELKIPGSIREAVRERVEKLSVEARATLAVAAVIGLQFDFETLRAVRGSDETAIEQHLRELIDGQLAVELEGADERYAFRHALTKEVVYDDLLVRERKRFHRAVADALATARREPSLLAHHLLAAGETARAVPQLIAAGDHALRAGAPREAAAHYAKAIEIGLPDEELPSVIERQAEAYFNFDIPMTLKTAEEAIALYETRGDTRGRSRMLRLAGRCDFYQSRFADAERRTEEAIRVLDGAECVELARATAQLGGLLMARTQMEAATPHVDRAIELGERLGDPWALANALISKGSLTRDPAVAHPWIRRGIDIATRNGLLEAALRGYNNASLRMIVAAADVKERRELIEEGLAYGRRHGVERAGIAYLHSVLAGVQFFTGDWDAALATAELIDEGTTVRFWTALYAAHAALARRGPMDVDLELAELARMLETRTTVADVQALAEVTAMFARAGRVEEARSYLARLQKSIADYPRGAQIASPRSMLGGPAAHTTSEVALLLDEPALLDDVEAEIIGFPLAPMARSWVEAGRTLLRGDPDRAADAMDRVHELAARVGFEGLVHIFLITLVREARRRELGLGSAWARPVARTRDFAQRVRAKWWLDVLAEAGV